MHIHDDTGQIFTTVAEEKQFNNRLHLKKSEFTDIMVNLGKQLGLPKKFRMLNYIVLLFTFFYRPPPTLCSTLEYHFRIPLPDIIPQ